MKWQVKNDLGTISSSDFYYDLFEGGYIKPENILADEKQIKQLEKAIALIESFKSYLEDNEIIDEE